MTRAAHARAILALGLPLIGGHLAQFAIGLTDTVMMGWYGVPELAAMTLATSLYHVFLLFGAGFGWAVMPMVAGFATTGDDQQIRRATRMGLWLSAIFFFAVMPLMWASAPILRAIGQEEQVALDAQTYLRIAGWGMLPALGVMVLRNYLAGLEHTRIVFWITVAAAIANALANYALIFGNWGAPEMGLRGAAWASVVSHSVSLVLVIAYALRRLPEHALFQRLWRPDWEMFASVARLGIPIGLTTLAEVALFAMSAVMMGWLGTIPLAAHGIALQIATATFMVHLGLANAATVRASTAYGRRDAQHLARGAQVAVMLSLGMVALATVLFVTLPDLLLGAFVDPTDPARDAIIALGTLLLIFAALFQLVDAMQVVNLGLLRGLQDTSVPMVIASLAYWGVGLPCAYVFGFVLDFGAGGIWSGLVSGLGVAAVLLAWRFWRIKLPELTGQRGLAPGRIAH
ncbi:MATE family efflux transporter [Thalassococcus sp. CAU 1522]|uniref:Multidrug-efflux transporter n=2 Tax=Thalassococcus arenae TaxID=2851652 RepID=A0ABS6N342_9RHOB|nr:MATE family efflux transporter [Thalassococcus arenae]